MDSVDKDYWNAFYSVTALHRAPSQFAAFVANEYATDFQILDLGCGNGRDSWFFASLGHYVIGIDESKEAVEAAKNVSQGYVQDIGFHQMDIVEAVSKIGELGFSAALPIVAYARFVYHSLTESKSEAFLQSLSNAAKSHNLHIALEFRNSDDALLHKVHGDHFRRFESAGQFRDKCKSNKLRIIYESSGVGFAKYKFEDASVTRALLKAED